MGARAEALARQFETKAKDATAVLERLSEADWKKTTETEKWPVGVVAHHVAGGYEAIAGIVKTIAEGKPGPNLPMDALHAMNTKHAQEHANCTKAETVALHKKNAAAAWPNTPNTPRKETLDEATTNHPRRIAGSARQRAARGCRQRARGRAKGARLHAQRYRRETGQALRSDSQGSRRPLHVHRCLHGHLNEGDAGLRGGHAAVRSPGRPSCGRQH